MLSAELRMKLVSTYNKRVFRRRLAEAPHIQFWEEPAEAIQFSHTAADVYNWLASRLFERSGDHQRSPIGMPTTFTGLSMVTSRNGKEGRILFTLIDSYADSLRDQPVKAQVTYFRGYTRIGMRDRYTLMMLASELWTLTRNNWEIYPMQAIQTKADGTICHGTYDNPDDFQSAGINSFALIPEKVLAATPRGTSIRVVLDQAHLLQYFAWAEHPIETGIALPVDNFTIEYWFQITLQQLPDEDDLKSSMKFPLNWLGRSKLPMSRNTGGK
jgi:hypothetical protein